MLGNHDITGTSHHSQQMFHKRAVLGACTVDKPVLLLEYDGMAMLVLDCSPRPHGTHAMFGLVNNEWLSKLDVELAFARQKYGYDTPLIVFGHCMMQCNRIISIDPLSFVFHEKTNTTIDALFAKYKVTHYLSGHLHTAYNAIPQMVVQRPVSKTFEWEAGDFKENQRTRIVGILDRKFVSYADYHARGSHSFVVMPFEQVFADEDSKFVTMMVWSQDSLVSLQLNFKPLELSQVVESQKSHQNGYWYLLSVPMHETVNQLVFYNTSSAMYTLEIVYNTEGNTWSWNHLIDTPHNVWLNHALASILLLTHFDQLFWFVLVLSTAYMLVVILLKHAYGDTFVSAKHSLVFVGFVIYLWIGPWHISELYPDTFSISTMYGFFYIPISKEVLTSTNLLFTWYNSMRYIVSSLANGNFVVSWTNEPQFRWCWKWIAFRMLPLLLFMYRSKNAVPKWASKLFAAPLFYWMLHQVNEAYFVWSRLHGIWIWFWPVYYVWFPAYACYMIYFYFGA